MANYENVEYSKVSGKNVAPGLRNSCDEIQVKFKDSNEHKYSKMCEELRILFLLLHKNLTVRKFHLIGTLIECVFPALIVAAIMALRSSFDVTPIHVKDNTYFPILTRADLIDHIPRSILQLYYKPQNNFTNNLMKKVTRCTKLPHNQVFGFDTEDDMLQSYEILQARDELMSVLAVNFDDTEDVSLPKKLSYTIRSSQPIPDQLFNNGFEGFSIASDKLIERIPIVALQTCLNDEFINIAAPDGAIKPTVVIQKMPYPPYDNINPAEVTVQNIMCMLAQLMFYTTIYLIPSYISAEKTTGVNTLLKMNGVKSYQNFFSWLVSGMLFSILPVFAITMIVKLNFVSDQKAFYYHSNCIIIWLSLFINVTHIYAFCLHIASYFSKAWLAQMVAVTIPMSMTSIVTYLESRNRFSFMPWLGIVCPTVATTRIFDELNNRENGLTGAQWSNVFETVHPALTMLGSLGSIMLFGILGILFHFSLALYLNAVLPSQYHVHESPLFFLKKKNKVCNSYITECSGQPKLLEPVADGVLCPGIQLRNLAKCFRSGWLKSYIVNAVQGVSMDFYKGQITALLGHNGAGKTTTFSILTGLTPPSAGTVYINGKDISKELDSIRNDLGVCPQENTMFPDLTVQEQLEFIGRLKQKNKTVKVLRQEVDDLMEKLNISEKRDVMPDKLSGGQKRRLCLGMALIGNASTLFLDEPTSGMDPETSRGTWDIILKYRKQKTIIITTHSMEEADVLGDRIAIMHSGQMKCYGSSMFLKKYYGHQCHEVTLSTTPQCNEAKIQDMIGDLAQMNVTHQGRIVVSIPFTSTLPAILDNLENHKAELGITGVSVSTMTMEQVFLKVAEEKETDESTDHVDGIEESVAEEYKYLTGLELTLQKFRALLTKKIIYLKTDKSLYLAIVLGSLLAIVLPALLSINGNNKTSSSLLDLGLYQSPEVLIYSKNQDLGNTYKKIIRNQGGTGILTKTEASLSNELLSRAAMDLAYYKSRMILSAEFNSSSLLNGLYSGGAIFSAPISVNAMSNFVLKTVAGDQYSIVTNIGNLPRTSIGDAENRMLVKVGIIIRIVLFVTIFFHVVSLFVKHPLMENTTKIKQLQQMTGVSSFLYWTTTFLIDYALYIVITVFTVLGIFLMDSFSKSNTIHGTEIGILLLLFILFGINALLLAYIHSFIKKRFHVVYSILSSVPMLLAIIMICLREVLPIVENAEKVNLIQRRIFSLEPHVSFVLGYLKFSEIAADNALCRGLSNRLNEVACVVNNPCCEMKCFDGQCANPLPYFAGFREEGGFEEFILYLLLTPIILVCILSLLEQQAFGKLWSLFQIIESKSNNSPDKMMDSEVEKEKSIIYQAINQRSSDPNWEDKNVFLTYGLRKSYGNLEAVKEVNFRVKENECFGLLGVNGAGKSTTFRMLVGEELASSGILYRGPYSIKSNRTKYLAEIGYCPQTDALIPHFNAVEHLTLFAHLRGIPNSKVASHVWSWINKMGLNAHAKNPSKCYSGGNKRRLNIAIALIGGPKMVLLDEPTTGVDPAARRSVWTVLKGCQASGQAIILTSHSMAECEALCNRLVIMVKGRLLCVGASQELKNRFGAGYNIIMKLNPGRSRKDFIEIKEKIQTAFDCELEDEHPGYLFYHITDSNATWVKMFGTMDNLKSEYECIEDFTVSTSTLEQLFMQFARSSAGPTAESHTLSQTTTEADTLVQKASKV